MFQVLALHIPVILAATSLRAALEGAQRFDISTSLRVPSSIASIAVPAFAASMGASLGTILWLLLAVRVSLLCISAAVVSRTLLPRGWGIPKSLDMLAEMFRYSGWVAVSTLLSPALASFDRFVLGSVVGVTGLGYYTGAGEAANRFLLIPATAFSAMLPAISATDARGDRRRSLRVTRAALRQLAALLLPVCLILLVFAPQLLSLWLGPAFGERSGTALRILTVGVFFGGLAHLPMALLYGSGRPDLPAKIHLCEVVVYLPLVFLLVKQWGITGAAIAWATRCTADFLLYEIVSRRALGVYVPDASESSRTRWLAAVVTGFVVLLALAVWIRSASVGGTIVVLAMSSMGYAALSWALVLSVEERRAWTRMVFSPRSRSRA
jgi:O-antigen/teichoic acid export membrane protein